MLFGKRERVIRRILIVEDEPLVAFDTEHMLEEAGYKIVDTVDNLADAQRVIADEAIDLILSDVQLRGDGDGIDVAKAAAAKGVPLLFVSGNCPVEARSLAVGCLAKPYADRILKAALDALDARFQGKPAKKSPPGLSLYDKD